MDPSAADGDLERAIGERGRLLLRDTDSAGFLRPSAEWWQDRLLAWATADPSFRTKLLQFIDVLPTLRTSRAVSDHVRQYFRGADHATIRVGADVAGRAVFRPLLSQVVRRGVFAMAARFIGGATPEEAISRLEPLRREGITGTFDLLGEATLSDHEADVYAGRYVALLDALSREKTLIASHLGAPNVSIKLSALTPHFEPAAPLATLRHIEPRLLPILEHARACGGFVCIDMEQHRYRDLSHRVYRDFAERTAFRDWDGLGIVVQAYLRDASEDIVRLADLARARGAPITVRLVKGAYWDEETVIARQVGHPVPVFEAKGSTDASFEHCTDLLLGAYPHLLPAFASHNPRSVAQAMVRAERAGVPREAVEFQVLYGMAEGLRKAIHDVGYRTRVYVPIGAIIPGMAYLVRRLLENTSNESWLLHRHEGADPEAVLVAPIPGEKPAEAVSGFANHPPAEFHLPAVRAEMESALSAVRSRFGASYPVLISGREVDAGAWDEVRPPAHPALVMGRVGRARSGDVDRAVAEAEAAYPPWREAGGRKRARILRDAAQLVDARRFELAAIMAFESAKPWREADGDVCEAIDFLRYYADQAEALAAGVDLSSVPGEENRLLYEGRGVVGVIAPWNFPLAILAGMSGGALAAGCPVVIKPASQSPIIASRLVSILLEAGVPPGAVHYLPGPGGEVGQRIVDDPRVEMIAFTGSNAVGLGIVEAAARRRPDARGLRRVIAELGGKNAIVVDEDADLDQAVAGVVASAFGYAGQKCSACSRVIVVGEAYYDFRSRLAAAVESLVVGPAEDPFTTVPPVISARAKATIEEYIGGGLAEGTLVAVGASRDDGHYVAPHVFEGLGPRARLSCEEVFGPVLTLYRAQTFDEALDIALDSDFALTGGVYSRNPRSIARSRERFRVGNLYINRKVTGAAVGRQPFGGFRMSGTDDKAGGPDYVKQFTVARVVTEDTMRRGFLPYRAS